MADVAIFFAVEKLGDALIHKVNFLVGVEDEVRWVKDELQSMQCFLKDAAQQGNNKYLIRKWISDVREIAQAAEDVIEIFTLKLDAPTRKRDLVRKYSCFPVHASHLNKVGKEIKSIRTRLDEIAKRRETYEIQNLGEVRMESSSEMVQLPRRMVNQQVVGLNEDVDLLVNKVIQGRGKGGLSVAAIVGKGGIGKSTLARKIYNHPDVAAQFDHYAWVVVSYQFEAEDLIKEIMQQLPSPPDLQDHINRLKKVEKVKDKQTRIVMLKEMLYQRLNGKRYFIVLDDLYEHADWELLKSAFPADEQGEACGLLVTSRNESIAMHTGYCYEMKLLNEDESWELLLNTAFGCRSQGTKCPPELEGTGIKILKRCYGLPLAIKLAGGLLVYQVMSKIDWEGILKQIRYYTDEIGISSILELSYHNLPSHLRLCFLCLAFFKEDKVIQVRRLVHIWVALGLVQGGKESAEEIARGYLDELINRNLIQIKSLNINGGVKYCHVHDLLHDLSIKKAEEEIGFELLISQNERSSSSSFKPRHRVVRGKELIISSNENKHLRSLFLHVEIPNDTYFSTPSNWKGFGLLRILDIECSKFKELPSKIRASIRIRYLRLREKMSVLILPSWLDDLKNLEILDVGSEKVVVFPDVTWKMDNLRHFYINSYCRKFSDSMKKSSWKNLETFKCVRPGNMLQGFNCRLHKLSVEEMDAEGEIEVWRFLEESQVQVLHLRWEYKERNEELLIPNFQDHLTILKLTGLLHRFSSVDKLPRSITHLILSDSYITRNEVMQELGKLPNLLVLKLDYALHPEYLKMEVLLEGFPKLRVLHLMKMFELVNLEIKEDGMPDLQRVEIYQCPRFQTENLRNRIKPPVISINDFFL